LFRLPEVRAMKRSSDLAYVIGLLLGDGYVYRTKTGYCIQFDSIDKKLIEDFNRRICNIFERHKLYAIRKEERSWGTITYRVRVYNKQLYNLLRKPLKSLLNFVLSYPEAFTIGFFNADGSVWLHRVNSKTYPKLQFYNSDKNLLNIIKKILENLGYHPTLVGPYKQRGFGRKPMYRVCMSRKEEVESFIKAAKKFCGEIEKYETPN